MMECQATWKGKQDKLPVELIVDVPDAADDNTIRLMLMGVLWACSKRMADTWFLELRCLNKSGHVFYTKTLWENGVEVQ